MSFFSFVSTHNQKSGERAEVKPLIARKFPTQVRQLSAFWYHANIAKLYQSENCKGTLRD